MTTDEVIVVINGHEIRGHRCTFADFKQRRLERLIRDDRVELVSVDEYLARHNVDMRPSKE